MGVVRSVYIANLCAEKWGKCWSRLYIFVHGCWDVALLVANNQARLENFGKSVGLGRKSSMSQTCCYYLVPPRAVDIFLTSCSYELQGFHAPHFMSRTSTCAETPWAQRGPRNDNRNLRRRWWGGLNNPSVGKGIGRWEHFPPTKTRSHARRVMSYAELIACKFDQNHLVWRCKLGNIAIWVGRYLGTTLWNCSGLGVAPKIVKIWTTIISSILSRMR